MSQEVFLIIVYIQTTLSALIASLVFTKHSLKSAETKLIGLLYLIGFLTNATSLIFHFLKIRGYGNIPQSVYDILSVMLLTFLYYTVLERMYPRRFLYVAITFLVFFFVNILFIQKTSINSYSKWLAGVIVISYTLVYFFWLMRKLPTTQIHQSPMFWFNSAFLIYYSGSVLLFIFTDYLVNVLKNNLLIYWSIHNILSIIEHLIILVGLYFGSRNNGVLHPQTSQGSAI